MRILLINPFGIGDCLFTTPVVAAMKSAYPDSYIGYWSNQRVGEILKANPKINIVFPLSRGDIKRFYGNSLIAQVKQIFSLYGKIKRERFDISLDFSLDHRYGLLAKLAGIRRRIGIDYKNRGRFLTEKLKIDGYQDKHIVEYYLQLLPFLNIKASTSHLELFIEDSAKKWAKSFLENSGVDEAKTLIGLCPGAGESWGKDASFKRLEPKKFAKACDWAIEHLSAKVVLFGNKQDEEACAEVYQAIAQKSSVIKAYPDFTLSQFSALLQRCKLLLTNDGGPLHMAVALGLKSISIFGPVSEVVYGPYPMSDRHIAIKADCNCRPCYQNFRFPQCHQERRCLTDISAQRIFDALERLL